MDATLTIAAPTTGMQTADAVTTKDKQGQPEAQFQQLVEGMMPASAAPADQKQLSVESGVVPRAKTLTPDKEDSADVLSIEKEQDEKKEDSSTAAIVVAAIFPPPKQEVVLSCDVTTATEQVFQGEGQQLAHATNDAAQSANGADAKSTTCGADHDNQESVGSDDTPHPATADVDSQDFRSLESLTSSQSKSGEEEVAQGVQLSDEVTEPESISSPTLLAQHSSLTVLPAPVEVARNHSQVEGEVTPLPEKIDGKKSKSTGDAQGIRPAKLKDEAGVSKLELVLPNKNKQAETRVEKIARSADEPSTSTIPHISSPIQETPRETAPNSATAVKPDLLTVADHVAKVVDASTATRTEPPSKNSEPTTVERIPQIQTAELRRPALGPELKVELKLEQLGRVEVSASLRNEEVRAIVKVDSAEARTIIAGELGRRESVAAGHEISVQRFGATTSNGGGSNPHQEHAAHESPRQFFSKPPVWREPEMRLRSSIRRTVLNHGLDLHA